MANRKDRLRSKIRSKKQRERRNWFRKGHFENLEERRLLAYVPADPDLGIFVDQGGGPINSGQVTNLRTGNFVTGQIESVLTHPHDADIVFAASAFGGIWKTSDATASVPTWIPTTDSMDSLSVRSLNFDTDDHFDSPQLSVDNVTGNAVSPIQITITGHGLDTGTNDGRVAVVEGVEGNTSANGRWKIDVIDANTIELTEDDATGVVSTGNANGTPGTGTFVFADIHQTLVASAESSVYVSTDAGNTWTNPGSAGTIAGENLTRIVSQNNAQTIVVTSESGDVHRSTDGGASFNTTGGPPTGSGFSYDLVADLSTENRLYAASPEFGVFRSDNFGGSWTLVSTGALSALILDSNPGRVDLAVHEESGRLVASVIKNGQIGGIFFSDDADVATPTWTEMDVPVLPASAQTSIPEISSSTGLPIAIEDSSPSPTAHGLNEDDLVIVEGVTGVPGANGRFRVHVVDDFEFELKGSSGTGNFTASSGNYTRVVTPTPNRDTTNAGQRDVNFSIGISPDNHDLIFIGGDQHVTLSPNPIGADDFTGVLFRGDASVARDPNVTPSPQWDHLTDESNAFDPNGGTGSDSAPHSGSRHITFDARGELIEASGGGIFRRTSPADNTGDWESMVGILPVDKTDPSDRANLGTLRLSSVAYDTNSNIIAGSDATNGSVRQLAEDSVVWTSLLYNEDHQIAVAPHTVANQSIWYTSGPNFSNATRHVFDASNNLLSSTPLALSGLSDATFYTPFSINAIDSSRILVGTQSGVYQSSDRGDTFVPVGTGFSVPSGFSAPIAYGGNSASGDNINIAYVGDVNGKVWVRRNATDAFANQIDIGNAVRDIKVNPNEWSEAIAISDSEIYRTADAGISWTKITENPDPAVLDKSRGLGPSGLNVGELHSLEYISGAFDGLVVGTESGIYAMTFDAIGEWFQFGSGLPNATVADMDYDVADDVLVVGTEGRGAWKLEDASTFLRSDISLSISQNTVGEASGDFVNVVATLSRPLSYDVTVTYSASGTATLTPPVAPSDPDADYQINDDDFDPAVNPEFQINIQAGALSGSIQIQTFQDADETEGDETVVLTVTAVNPSSSGTITGPVIGGIPALVGPSQVSLTIEDGPAPIPDLPDNPERGIFVEQGGTLVDNGHVPNATGPFQQVTGAIQAVLPHPTDANTMWVGTANGGIWRTTNATATNPTWVPLTDDLPSLVIGAMEFERTRSDTNRPSSTYDTIVAATRRTGNFDQPTSYGAEEGLVYLTEDGGDTWIQVGGNLLGHKVVSVAAYFGLDSSLDSSIVDPTERIDRIVVATDNGLFKSERSLNLGGGFGAFSPVSRNVGGQASVNFVSDTNLAGSGERATALVMDRSTSTGRLYAAIEGKGIYRSDDFGTSWTDPISDDNATLQASVQAAGVAIDVKIAVSPLSGRLVTTVLHDGVPQNLFQTDTADTNAVDWFEHDLPTLPITDLVDITAITNPGTATPQPRINITTSGPHGLIDSQTSPPGDTIVLKVRFSNGSGPDIISNTFTDYRVESANTISIPGPGRGTLRSGANSIQAVRSPWSLDDGLPDPNKITLAIDPLEPDIVYIGTNGVTGGTGVNTDFNSRNGIGADDDYGLMFRGDLTLSRQRTDLSSINYDSISPQWDNITSDVAAGDRSSRYDPGTGNNTAPFAGSRNIAFDASFDLIEVNDGGVFRRTDRLSDNGDWESLAGSLSVLSYHDIAYDSYGNTIIAGSVLHGTQYQESADSLDWKTFDDPYNFTIEHGGHVAVNDTLSDGLNPLTESIRYITDNTAAPARLRFRSTEWDATGALVSGPSGLAPFNDTGSGFPRSLSETPFVINAVQPSRLLLGSRSGLYQSFNAGTSVSRADTTSAPITLGSFVSDPIAYGGYSGGLPNDAVIYAGDQNGLIHARADAAAFFTSIDPDGADSSPIVDLVMNPVEWREAFSINDRKVFMQTLSGPIESVTIGTKDLTGNLSTDFGLDLSTGDADADGNDERLHSIEYIRKENIDGTFHAGIVVSTDRGIFGLTPEEIAKPEGTQRWFRYGTELPDIEIFDMDYDSADDVLVIGTLGRGAWKLNSASTFLSPQVTLSVNGPSEDPMGTPLDTSDDVFVVTEDQTDRPDTMIRATLSRQVDYPILVTLNFSGDAIRDEDGAQPAVEPFDDYTTASQSVTIEIDSSALAFDPENRPFAELQLSALADSIGLEEYDENLVITIESIVANGNTNTGGITPNPLNIAETGIDFLNPATVENQSVSVIVLDAPTDLPPNVSFAVPAVQPTALDEDPSLNNNTASVTLELDHVFNRDVIVTLEPTAATQGIAEYLADYEFDSTAPEYANVTSVDPIRITIPAYDPANPIVPSSVTIPIKVLNDNLHELEEAFSFKIIDTEIKDTTDTAPFNVNDTVTYTIADSLLDDPYPIVTLSVVPGRDVGTEDAIGDAGRVTFQATLDRDVGRNVAVPLVIDPTSTALPESIGSILGEDFRDADLTIEIPAGSRTGTLTLPILSDDLDELNETIVLNVEIPDTDRLLKYGAVESVTPQQATATIIDDPTDTPPTVTISALPTIVQESGTNETTIKLTLSEVSGRDIVVNLGAPAAATDPATVGNDFTIPSSVTIPAGAIEASFTIDPTDDGILETDETAIVEITSVDTNGAIIGTQSQASFEITDDDIVAKATISVDRSSIPEDSSAFATFTVSLSEAIEDDVTITLGLVTNTAGRVPATQGTDYSLSSTQITIPAGSTSLNGSVRVDAIDDPFDESDGFADAEYITLEILSVLDPLGAAAASFNTTDGTHNATTVIIDDDERPNVSLTVDRGEVLEGDTANLIAVLDARSEREVTVEVQRVAATSVAFGGGVDFDDPVQVTIPAGNVSAPIPITTIMDLRDEEDLEFLEFEISSAINATIASTAGGPFVEPAVTHTQTQNASISNAGSPVESELYIPDNGSIQDLDVSIRITHPRVDDLTVTLVSPAGTRVVLVQNEGGATANFTNTTFDEGATATITPALSPFTGVFNPTGDLDSLNGEELRGRWTLEISDSRAANNGTLLDWSITAVRDRQFPRRAELDIVDVDDVPELIVSIDQTSINEAGGTATITAALPIVSGNQVLSNRQIQVDFNPKTVTDAFAEAFGGLAGSTGTFDYTISSDRIIIPADPITGSTALSGTITVRAIQDTVDERDELASADPTFNALVHDVPEVATVVVTGITNATTIIGGSTSETELTTEIIDDDLPARVSIDADVNSINEDGGVATITVSLDGGQISGKDIQVPISIFAPVSPDPFAPHLGYQHIAFDGIDYTISTTSVTIPAGDTVATTTIDITSLTDTLDEHNETIVIDLDETGLDSESSWRAGASKREVITILDQDELPSLSMSSAPAQSNEGAALAGQSVMTVSLDAISGRDVTVRLNRVAATSSAFAEDFVNPNPTGTVHTIAAGTTSISIPIETLFNEAVPGESIDEYNELLEFEVVPADAFSRVAASGISQTAPPYSTSPNAAILDGATTTSSITIADSGSIQDLNLTLNVLHNRVSDLTASLESPSGTTIVLFDGIGGNNAHFQDTVLDEQAGTALTAGTQPFTGSFNPPGDLNAFNGEELQGEWKLHITDNGGPFNIEGLLQNWSLEVQRQRQFPGRSAFVIYDQDPPPFVQLTASRSTLAVSESDDITTISERENEITITATLAEPSEKEILITVTPRVVAAVDEQTEAVFDDNGTSDFNDDYQLDSLEFRFAPKERDGFGNFILSKDITLNTIDDQALSALWEYNENIVLDFTIREILEDTDAGVMSVSDAQFDPTGTDYTTTSPSQATMTITLVDDDVAPTVTLAAVTTPFDEETGNTTFTATLSKLSSRPILVQLAPALQAELDEAIPGVDYTNLATDLQILVDRLTMSNTLDIGAISDDLSENVEPFTLSIDTAQDTVLLADALIGAGGLGTPTAGLARAQIADNDAEPVVTLTTSLVAPTDPTVDFTATPGDIYEPATATRLGGPDTIYIVATLNAAAAPGSLRQSGRDAVTIDVDAPNSLGIQTGIDFTQLGEIVINEGDIVGWIALTPLDDTPPDSRWEADELVTVSAIATQTVGVDITATAPTQFTILADEPGPEIDTFVASVISIDEDGGTADFEVTLKQISDRDVTVTFEVDPSSTAVENSDYTVDTKSITIPAGQLTGSITVTGLSDDPLNEPVAETVVINVTGIVNGDPDSIDAGMGNGKTAQVLIIDNDNNEPFVSLSVDAGEIAERNPGDPMSFVTITATLDAVAELPVTVFVSRVNATSEAIGGGPAGPAADFVNPIPIHFPLGPDGKTSLEATTTVPIVGDDRDEDDAEFVEFQIVGFLNNFGRSAVGPQTDGPKTYASNRVVTALESPALPIADTSVTTSDITIPDSLLISDLDVTVDIEHSDVSQLTLVLESPSGTLVTLVAAEGGNANFTGTIFDEDVATVIDPALAPYTGRFNPSGNLDAFNGEQLAGTWTLRITDSGTTTSKQLNSWSITARESVTTKIQKASANLPRSEYSEIASRVCGEQLFRVMKVDGGMSGTIHLAGTRNSDLAAAGLTNVFIVKDGEMFERTVTDENGNFSIDRIPSGEYALLAVGGFWHRACRFRIDR